MQKPHRCPMFRDGMTGLEINSLMFGWLVGWLVSLLVFFDRLACWSVRCSLLCSTNTDLGAG
jgi:hypothetical protein